MLNACSEKTFFFIQMVYLSYEVIEFASWIIAERSIDLQGTLWGRDKWVVQLNFFLINIFS